MYRQSTQRESETLKSDLFMCLFLEYGDKKTGTLWNNSLKQQEIQLKMPKGPQNLTFKASHRKDLLQSCPFRILLDGISVALIASYLFTFILTVHKYVSRVNECYFSVSNIQALWGEMCTGRQMPGKLQITKVNIRDLLSVCVSACTHLSSRFSCFCNNHLPAHYSTLSVTSTSAISPSNGNTFKHPFLSIGLVVLWVWELLDRVESTFGKKGWSTYWEQILLGMPTEQNKVFTQNHHSYVQLTPVSTMHITAID